MGRQNAVRKREETLKILKRMFIAFWSAVCNCTERSMLLCAGMDYSKKIQILYG